MAQGNEKTSTVQETVHVKAGTTPEDVVRLDREGKTLVFHLGKDFVKLGEEVVKGLSRTNRLMYHQLEQAMSDYSEEADEQHHSLEIGNTLGRYRDRLGKVKVPAGRRYRWVRPDNVGNCEARGYRVTPADKASTFLGATEGHHQISTLGKPELVLMDCDDESYKARKKQEYKKNLAAVRAIENRMDGEIQKAGGTPVKTSAEAGEAGFKPTH